MEDYYWEADSKKRLILSGIRELDEHGASDFSLRRVAQRCGVSCAAPYRHFKSRDALLLAIIRYVNSEWELLFRALEQIYAGDTLRLILECASAAVHFFLANDSYRAVLFSVLSDDDAERSKERRQIGTALDECIRKYCREQQRSGEAARSFAVRAVIYGAILMACDGEVPSVEDTVQLLRSQIRRILE